MFSSQWSQATTAMTQTGQAEISLLPFLEIRYLLDGPIILVGVQRNVARITTICNDPTYPHQNVPINETIVGFS